MLNVSLFLPIYSLEINDNTKMNAILPFGLVIELSSGAISWLLMLMPDFIKTPIANIYGDIDFLYSRVYFSGFNNRCKILYIEFSKL